MSWFFLRLSAYVGLLATRSEVFKHPLLGALIVERGVVGRGRRWRPAHLLPGSRVNAFGRPTRAAAQELPGMLTEFASRPTACSSRSHQRRDPHKALANLALLTLRYAEIAVGLSSCGDHASKVDHTLLSRRSASVEALQGYYPTRDREPVNHCSFCDPGSTTAVEGSSGWRWEPSLPRSIGRRSWGCGGSR